MDRDQLIIERARIKKARGRRHSRYMTAAERFTEVYARACYTRRRRR